MSQASRSLSLDASRRRYFVLQGTQVCIRRMPRARIELRVDRSMSHPERLSHLCWFSSTILRCGKTLAHVGWMVLSITILLST